ncbi:hypothetical protein AC781_00370 [Akkermansia glycaniphila]|nr:hypothetical protein AC781_10900 [Akkermansia glycaniphila]OCA04182.1 hypothetical protein AC781_00370 [Akkermansia glycaniphila]
MEEGDALLPSRQDRIRKHNKFHLLAFSFQIWNGIILRFLNPYVNPQMNIYHLLVTISALRGMKKYYCTAKTAFVYMYKNTIILVLIK